MPSSCYYGGYSMEDKISDTSLPKTRCRKPKDDFKEKECEIISYNQNTKSLDVKFDGYGIRIKNVESFHNNSTMVKIKYKGNIGMPDFVMKVY